MNRLRVGTGIASVLSGSLIILAPLDVGATDAVDEILPAARCHAQHVAPSDVYCFTYQQDGKTHTSCVM